MTEAVVDVPADVGRYRRLLPWAITFSLLSIVLVVVLFGFRSDQDVQSALAVIDWRFLPLALSLHVMAHIFWAGRYALIAQGFGVPLTGPTAWRIVTAGVFAGAVTPGKVGGEGLKLAILLRRGLPIARAGRLLLTDRAVDLVFFLLLGLVAVGLLPPLFGAEGAAARAFALAGTGFLSLFLLLLFSLFWYPDATSRALSRLARGVARLLRRTPTDLEAKMAAVLHEVRLGLSDILGRRPGIMVAAALLTAANWIVEYGVLWTLLRGFGYDIPFWAVFFVGIVLTMVANIPLTPGGSGVAELAALALLLPLAPGLSPLFVVAWRGVTYYYDIAAGAAMSAFMLPRRAPLVSLHDNP